MPFDPAPVAVPVIESPFKEYAAALLKACAETDPLQCSLWERGSLWRRDKVCALGAIIYGVGGRAALGAFNPGRASAMRTQLRELNFAYELRYGHPIERDNDSLLFTREQIAARIAAL